MDLNQLIDGAISDTLSALPAFAPEITLCATIFIMLIVRVIDGRRWTNMFWFALAGASIALFYTAPWEHLSLDADTNKLEFQAREIFGGMLLLDTFTIYMRATLLFFAVLFIICTRITGIPDKDDGVDFYCLVFGALLGMCLMSSANHLLMVFLAVEMASVPSYALVGFLKGRRLSTEAALKYSIYGAGTAGIMLYGISLIAGVTHSAHLPTIAQQLALNLGEMSSGEHMVLALGGLMLAVGLAFKLSAVPFHFWCPDVFEGASAEVNAFLSVASKAAALALLVRVTIGIGAINESRHVAEEPTASSVATGLFAVADEADEEAAPATDTAATTGDEEPESKFGLDTVRNYMGLLIAILAIITCTFGNLAAYGQTNIKRLLAYSTIAHAGYMMMAVPPALALIGTDKLGAENAIAALALYIIVYVFMNLGAFAVVAVLRNSLGSEEIVDYAGLIKRSPGVVIVFALILFSLVGLPPLAGFLGKFAIFASLANAYGSTSQTHLMILLIAGGINTAISLFYYLRVVKVMVMDPEADSATNKAPVSYFEGAYLWLLALPIAALIVSWNTLYEWTVAAASQLL